MAVSALIVSFIQMPKLQSVDVQSNQLSSDNVVALNLVVNDLIQPLDSLQYSSGHNSSDMIVAFINVFGCTRSIPLKNHIKLKLLLH